MTPLFKRIKVQRKFDNRKFNFATDTWNLTKTTILPSTEYLGFTIPIYTIHAIVTSLILSILSILTWQSGHFCCVQIYGKADLIQYHAHHIHWD